MAEAFLWDRFREVEALGEGGMGLVVKAEDLGLERHVAIKRLRPETSGDPEIRERFLQEAKATGQLEHPNIPPIYEMGCDEKDNPYFALKLVRGQTLAEIIAKLAEPDAKTHERYSFIERLQIFLKACEAVAYAHKRGVFHRDIKPENLMVGEFGEVFVMDWGLAKDEGKEAAYQTEAGAFFGTPMYAAPEVLSGEPASERSEVYSLGATLYHWLTIRPPFEGDNLRAILTNVLTGKLKDPVLLSPPHSGAHAR
jgi:serine/threonine protein kinase